MNFLPKLILFLLPLSQLERGTLIVEVRSGGHPVAGVQVRVGDKQVMTDARGRAQIALPGGDWTVLVSGQGFYDNKGEARVEAGATTRIEVELSARSESKEQVVVTAARSERRMEDQPVRVEVISREDIEEKALVTPGSVALVLSETTGLHVQTTAPTLGAANVRIQGLRGRYSQILSDGLPIYGLQGDSLTLLQVPPLDLGQVEIIKGAASALYGPSAVGGVINLISQRPITRHGELLINQSTRGLTDLVFWSTEPARGSWSFTLLGGLHGQQRQDLDDDGWTDLPRYFRGILRPRVFWDDGKGHSGFATLGIMAEDRTGGTLPDATAPDGKPFSQGVDSRRLDGGTVIRLALGKQRIITIRGSVSNRAERHVFGEDVERGNRTTWLGEVVLRGQAGRHNWLVGGALQQDSYAARDLPAFDYNFVTPGLFAQDEIELSTRLTLGMSGRIDHHSVYGTFASPRVSLLYKPSPDWTTRLSVGTGFFAPTPFTEETEETGLARVRPLRNVIAERARSASFDVGWTRGPYEAVATVFGSLLNNPLERLVSASGSIELINAPSPVRTWGSEFLFRYRVEDLLVIATHDYTVSTENDPEAPGRRSVPLTPRNFTTFSGIWEAASRGRIGIEASYVGRQPLDDNPYRASGRSYVLFGFFGEMTLGRVKLFANCENFGDIRQTRYDPLVRPARAADGRWTVDSWAPLDGRNINAGVRISF